MQALSGRAALQAKWLLAALVLALLPLLFLFGPDNYAPRSLKLAWQLGHVLFFGAAAGWAVLAVPRLRRMRWIAAMAWIVGITTVAGAGIEYLQGLTGRDSSWADLRLDVMGAVLAAGWMVGAGSRFERFLRWTVPALTAVGLAICDLTPLSRAVLDERSARREFPVLAAFESARELERWANPGSLALVDAPAPLGGRVLDVRLQPGAYPGFAMQYFPSDWQAFRTLQFSVYLDNGAAVTLTCRIHDLAHDSDNRHSDRYNRGFELNPGWNRIQIDMRDVESAPEGRRMDLAHIAGFGCFVADLHRPLRLLIDRVRLEL